MLAQTAGDVAEALRELPGEVAFEWKMDGARIQVHKAADEVRIYTRGLNEVTDAVPEIVEAVRGISPRIAGARWRGDRIRRSGAAASVPDHHASLRPQAQRRALRAELPIRAFFFDCLRLDGRSIAERPTHERFEALAEAVPASLRIPRLITSSEPAARGLLRSRDRRRPRRPHGEVAGCPL